MNLSDPFTERLLNLGRQADANMRENRIQRCNCMIRYKNGPQMPAIKDGKIFTDPEGYAIVKPDSFEMMPWHRVKALLAERGETYIGHMFNAAS